MPFGLHTFQPTQQEAPQPVVVLDDGKRAFPDVSPFGVFFLSRRLRHPLGMPFTLQFVLLAVDLPRRRSARHTTRSQRHAAHALAAAW